LNSIPKKKKSFFKNAGVGTDCARCNKIQSIWCGMYLPNKAYYASAKLIKSKFLTKKTPK
jgi:hypothetical protein